MVIGQVGVVDLFKARVDVKLEIFGWHPTASKRITALIWKQCCFADVRKCIAIVLRSAVTVL